jgi:malate synthase
MGGMAAFIPIKSDPEANRAAIDRVRADKLREASDGHDGTWSAHPGLVPIAKEVFDEYMPQANQLDKLREDVQVTAADLISVPQGPVTEEGLRNNLRVGIQYIEAWLGGLGCVPLYNLMEDAATAEICRSQVWQWLKHGAKLEGGRPIDEALVRNLLGEEMAKLKQVIGSDRYSDGHFAEAVDLFLKVAVPPGFIDFLTLPAYQQVTEVQR